MKARPPPAPASFAGFRVRLLVAIMVVVTAFTGLALYFAQRNLAAGARAELGRKFEDGLDSFHAIQQIRHATLAERSRALARRPRIHAALEDNALDLLYPSTRDELRDVMAKVDEEAADPAGPAIHARFYRFLDGQGAVIAPPDTDDVGPLSPEEELQLTLRTVPEKLQTGYLPRTTGESAGSVDEIIAVPIISTEDNRAIAALVLGFKPTHLPGPRPSEGLLSGIWTQQRLFLPGLPAADHAAIRRRLEQAGAADTPAHGLNIDLAGGPCLLFCMRLNPGSVFAPAYEVCIYPLTDLRDRQRRLLWRFSGAGGALLLGAFLASHYLSRRFSQPVEQMAVDSEKNRRRRQRAEAELELTHEELQRAARFSADASHQLKTPVTVLRAGLEELLAGEKITPETREEISTLVHQTFRLTSVIEDLLLLSRMDSGRLRLSLEPVDLTRLVEGWLDDLGALPDPHGLAIETDLPAALLVEGEQRYTTLILQNLLENARKYNRPGGRIRVTARTEGSRVVLAIGNTGPAIPAAAREHIFQRFHRGGAGENVPGHGLGLNLARELVRLHHGELRLAGSADDWTEFVVTFRLARPASGPAPRAV